LRWRPTSQLSSESGARNQHAGWGRGEEKKTGTAFVSRVHGAAGDNTLTLLANLGGGGVEGGCGWGGGAICLGRFTVQGRSFFTASLCFSGSLGTFSGSRGSSHRHRLSSDSLAALDIAAECRALPQRMSDGQVRWPEQPHRAEANCRHYPSGNAAAAAA
jgi:hypothetical protein